MGFFLTIFELAAFLGLLVDRAARIDGRRRQAIYASAGLLTLAAGLALMVQIIVLVTVYVDEWDSGLPVWWVVTVAITLAGTLVFVPLFFLWGSLFERRLIAREPIGARGWLLFVLLAGPIALNVVTWVYFVPSWI